MVGLVCIQGVTTFLEVNQDTLNEEELSDIRIQFGSVQSCMFSLYQGVSGGLLWGTSYCQGRTGPHTRPSHASAPQETL